MSDDPCSRPAASGNFWRQVFSESGEGSSSRVFTGFLIMAAVAWVTMLVYWNHALPDLAGLTLFIGSIYGINKGFNTIEAFKKNNNTNGNTPPNNSQTP